MIRRIAVLAVLALVVAGLFQLDDPHATPDPVPSPAIGAVFDAGSRTSTWYCVGAPDAPAAPVAAGAPETPANEIIITNPGRKASARITGYGTETNSGTSITATVAAKSQHVVSMADVGPGLGGVTVEISGGPVTVAHRMVGSNVEDQADCVTEASDTWYFASADTERDPAGVAHLWLLNPFPTDASVDIRISTDSLVRIPPKLRGVIVPAGSSRMVDLGESVGYAGQFSFSVEARGGRVAAELVQTVTGGGLRLEPGISSTAPSWLLADSFGGAGVTEKLNIFNPSQTDSTVAVSVIPNGYDPASFPEPFIVEIPGRRFSTVTLTEESRVPPDGLRWIRVDTVDGADVIVSQVVGIAGAGGDGSADERPPVAGGIASSGGSSAQATTWYLTSVSPTTDSQSVVMVANPSPDAIALVKVSKVSGGKVTVIADKQEVPPSSSLAIDVSAATAEGPIGLVIESSNPVVASGRTTSNARADLSMFPAIPLRSSVTKLPDPLGG